MGERLADFVRAAPRGGLKPPRRQCYEHLVRRRLRSFAVPVGVNRFRDPGPLARPSSYRCEDLRLGASRKNPPATRLGNTRMCRAPPVSTPIPLRIELFRTSRAEPLLQHDTVESHVGYAASDRRVVPRVDKLSILQCTQRDADRAHPFVPGCVGPGAAALSFPLLRQSQRIYRSVFNSLETLKLPMATGFPQTPYAMPIRQQTRTRAYTLAGTAPGP